MAADPEYTPSEPTTEYLIDRVRAEFGGAWDWNAWTGPNAKVLDDGWLLWAVGKRLESLVAVPEPD